MSLPSHVHRRAIPNAGTGLFTSSAIAPGQIALCIERPLVAVLDSKHLKDTCSNCYLWLPDDEIRSMQKQTAQQNERETHRRLSSCLGCKVMKYCSKDCQTLSWKRSHKFECKVFAKLHPNVLPNTVRMIMELLFRRDKKSISDVDWDSFMTLKSHMERFQAQQAKNDEGLTAWQTIELMSQAAIVYSGTKEPKQNVQGYFARLLINTHTLTTPTLDPLGLCLSPQSALLNHCCNPNAHIVFSGHRLTIRTLARVPQNAELTISYIDPTTSISTRQSELKSRYFFTCTCDSCFTSTTNGMPDPKPDPTFDAIEARALQMQSEAAHLPPSEAAPKLLSALNLFKSYPAFQQASPSIRHNVFLNAIATQCWSLAFEHALSAYFHIDPAHYPLSWHPVRVVRKWVLLRLVAHIAGLVAEGDESVTALEEYGIDWMVVAQGLWKEVNDGVPSSHGREGPFAEEMREFGAAIGVDERVFKIEAVKETWAKMRRIAARAGMSS